MGSLTTSIIPLLVFRLLLTSLMTWSLSSMSDVSLPSSDTSMNAPLAGNAIEFSLSDSLDCCFCSSFSERRCLNDLLWSFKCQLLSESSSFLKLNDVCALLDTRLPLLLLVPLPPSNDDKSWRWWWLLCCFELWFRLWREDEVEAKALALYGGVIRPRNVYEPTSGQIFASGFDAVKKEKIYYIAG